MANVGFIILEDTLSPILESADVRAELEEAAQEYADQILAYTQTNAPWDDRTGDARAGLEVQVTSDESSVIIELAHTVSYGLYLETIQDGRFAIIMPTLEEIGPEMFAELGITYEGEDLGDS